jgi:long-chain acyl-CoA synthetase
MTISELLETQARRFGDRTAFLYNDQNISYRQCNDLAGRVAGNLKAQGVGAGDKVVILSGNCPEFLYCFFGFGRIGAVIVPVNPTLALEELVYIINDSDAETLILTAELAPYLPKLRELLPKVRQCFVIGGSADNGAKPFNVLLEAVEVPEPAATEDSDAALIYTSGTTGTPKGVVLTHGNYVWNARAVSYSTALTSADRFLCVLPLFHVNAQVVSVLTPVIVGCDFVLIGGRFNPFGILPLIEKYRATIMSAVPTIYGLLCRMHNAEGHDISSMRFFVSGAAPMPDEIYEATQKVLRKPLIMGYGLSEATCASAVADHLDPVQWDSVGPALRYVNIRIVDAEGKDMPVGEVGEILISGPTVMKGYYKNPEATAEVLQGGWLKTGDLGCFDDKARLHIVDRVKDMIIRGGLNIYPVQIEQVISRMPEVEEVSVVGVEEPTWGQEVLAVVKLNADCTLTEKQVIAFCGEHLAQYKRPKFVRFVDELPKTAIGKVRKNELAKQFKDIGRHHHGGKG